MMMRLSRASDLLAFALLTLFTVRSPTSGADEVRTTLPPPDPNSRGGVVYAASCATCHDHGVGHAPAYTTLRVMTPSNIYKVLTVGPMRAVTLNIPDSDKKAVAEYLAGPQSSEAIAVLPAPCSGAAKSFDFAQTSAYAAAGGDLSNSREIAQSVSGVNVANVSKLKLKWAFGAPGATRMRSNPAIGGGAIFFGTDDGTVYALDRSSGCLRWQFTAASEVRTSLILSDWKVGDKNATPFVYFGDMVGNVYALDAQTGLQRWSNHTDDHPSVTITGSPSLHKNVLYVPVASLEEGQVNATYACCTFRGSIIAYDALSGKRLWKTYMLPEAVAQGVTEVGSRRMGPSGAAIWSAPAVDEKRGLLYFGTGNNYTAPATMSDSIVAMDLHTGTIRWTYQATAGDAWNGSCEMSDKTVCPKNNGADEDIAAAVILSTDSQGKQRILAGQKSGWVYAIDPDTHALIWKVKVGRGGILGGVYFGMAASRDMVYVPVSDPPDGRTHSGPAKPGIYALSLADGHYVWESPIDDSKCSHKGAACSPGIAAAVTVTDGLVLSGGSDGWLRFYDSRTGSVVWQYDTTQSVETVGGGQASGGSMGGATSPMPYLGTVLVMSGYGLWGRMPGNAMLVFDTK